jgi:hypothetical protein
MQTYRLHPRVRRRRPSTTPLPPFSRVERLLLLVVLATAALLPRVPTTF